MCCSCGHGFAQEIPPIHSFDDAPLVHVLFELETHYGIQFSYLDNLVLGRNVSLEINQTSFLTADLTTLQAQTALKFETIDQTHVVIRAFNPNDRIDGCGYLLDDDRHPVHNAAITIQDQESSIMTDKKGFFTFKNIGYDTPITLTVPGIDTLQTNSKVFIKEDCAFFYSKKGTPIFETLATIVIDDYLTRGITKKGHTMTMKTPELGILPGLVEPDILQSIQLAPGVSSPFETASGLYIRGGTPSQNLVLWNGIKTYTQGHVFGMLSTFNPYITKEVDFIKSGTNARYGDRVSGVIAIKTDDHSVQKISGGLGLNMINGDAHITVPVIKEKLSLQVSGRRSYTDFVQTPTYKQLATRVFQNTKIANASATAKNDQNDFYFVDYNLNAIAKLSKRDHIKANALYNKNNLDYRTNASQNSYNDLLKTENEGYHLEWKHQGSDQLTLQTAGYYSKYRMDYQFITRENNTTLQTETKKNSIRDYGASWQLEYQLNAKSNLSGGYQYSKNNIRYAFETITPSYLLTLDQNNNEIDTHALYAQYQYHHPQHLKVTLGLRGNYYTTLQKKYIEPRFFIQKQLGDYISINGSAEYRSQIVSQIKESVISDLNVENHIWTLANKEKFPPITSYQYSIGTTFKNNNWLFDLDTYYKKINNLTTLTTGFLNPIDNTFNLGNSTIIGLDVFLKKHFGNYNSWVSYAYNNAQNQFENLNEGASFRGNTVVEHTFRWSHFYTLNTFKFTLGWQWRTGKSFTEISDIDTSQSLPIINFGTINAENLPVYHRLDCSINYDFKLKSNAAINYRIGASLLNLYNHKNVLNREYRVTNTLAPEVINTEFYGLGITPNLSFRAFW